MKNKHYVIQRVPTNIITGFLGVGKTSAILQLLKEKPEGERWAVLVNEFGEIGVDGSLLAGQKIESQDIFIREVPGGCMCCAAGVPMQVALNQLLKVAKPDRLLIEPTGLGHPKEVLQVLSDTHYTDVLSLQKTLTLVDARNLSDERYTTHDTFNQQISIADILVGNKADLYQADDKSRLIAYAQKQGQAGVDVIFAEQGKIDVAYLLGEGTVNVPEPDSHHHHHHAKKEQLSEQPLPECGYLKAENQGEGFHSMGWRFDASMIFNHTQLSCLLTSLKVERLKGVFITDNGIVGYNGGANTLTEVDLEYCNESRIEVITEHLMPSVETQLLNCITR